MTTRYIIGDTRDVTATLPDASVDLILTSPPFLALRSYLPVDHPDKHREIGSEPTPVEFIDTLLVLTAEWGRVLAPHGSIAIELGDTYSGSGGAGRDYGDGGLREGQGRFAGSARAATKFERVHDPAQGPPIRTFPTGKQGGGEGWPLPKCKALIPELYRIALAYGINPLTGAPSPAGRWRVRNVVTWCRPNPPVGALGDKYRPATSDIVIACRSATRWFDLDAVRGPSSPNTHARLAKGAPDRYDLPSQQRDGNWNTLAATNGDPEAGAPPLDYWVIPPGGYPGSHYAVYPPELCIIPIESMCPRQVCTTCGEPRRRIVAGASLDAYRGSERVQTRRAVALADEHGLTDEHIAAVRAFGTSDAGKALVLNNGAGKNTDEVKRLAAEAKAVLGGYFREFVMSTNASFGSTWSTCGHDAWRSGVVFDPFAGSGTTLMVAHGHGRDAIGIDLDERNADLARERLGMFLDIEDMRVGI